MHLGGVLFVDSADKAARFIWLCDAFNVPLVFLADVPGFMIGSQVERQGIIRHGAKMITAVAEATVPKFSVIVRKAYGAGLYAMCGPAFDPDACLALPTAQIAVMGPDPAVNAVFYNRIQAIEDPDERAAFVAERRREYDEDVDLVHLAAELVVDAVVQPEDLRDELVRRLALGRGPGARRRGQAPRRPAGLSAVGSLASHTGCGAAWLARLTGGQEVAGSNPASPTDTRPAQDEREASRSKSGAVSDRRSGAVCSRPVTPSNRGGRPPRRCVHRARDGGLTPGAACTPARDADVTSPWSRLHTRHQKARCLEPVRGQRRGINSPRPT